MDTYRYGVRVVGHVFHSGRRIILPGFTDVTAESRRLDLAALSDGVREATFESARNPGLDAPDYISPEEARSLDELIDSEYQRFCLA